MTREEAEHTLPDQEQKYQRVARQTNKTSAVAADKVGKSELWGFSRSPWRTLVAAIGGFIPGPQTALINT